ncbi:hypothetical protein Bca4012_103484 [Brassica carinata]
MRDEPKPGYGAQLRANLEPTKGVGRLRQQDGGHGSRTAKECVTTHLPNQLAPKWMALKRDLYPPPGKSQASMSRRARVGETSPDSALCANFKGDPLKFRTGRAVDGNVRESETPGGIRKSYLFCLTACPLLKRLSRRQGKSAKWIRNFGKGLARGLGSGSQFNPPTVGGLLEPLTWRATASCRPGTDWERLFRAFPRRTANSELCSECQSEEIQPSAVNGGVTMTLLSQGNGLGRISGKEDPVELDSIRIRTVKAWPIDPLDLRNLKLEVSEKIHQVLDCSPTNRERELGLDRRETAPDSPRKGERVVMRIDDSPRGLKSPTDSPRRRKITHDILRGLKSPTDSPRKGQRVDMRIDDSPRGRKSPTDSPRRRKITHDSPRGLKSPTDSPRKGQRVDMRIDGQSSWAKITRQSTEGPTR